MGAFVLLLSMQLMDGSVQKEQNSHIDENVPSEVDFERILVRDLVEYFRRGATDRLTVQYELLRDAPTQAGTAYPKFYLWVTLSRNDTSIRYAVRVAAIERVRFDVTHAVDEAALVQDPESLQKIFPPDVCERIAARIRRQSK